MSRSIPRVLVVEDEFILALTLEAMIQELGWDMVGPVPQLAEAIRVARIEQLDGAVLDVNINEEMVFPVADILRARRIPFVFATGYGAAMLPPEYRDAPRVQKPYGTADLKRLIEPLFAAAPAPVALGPGTEAA